MRLGGEVARRRRHVLGVGAGLAREPRHPEDLVADREAGDAAADRGDHAGDVPAEPDRRLAEHPGDALARPGLEVDRVDPGGVDPHLDLGRDRLGRRHLLDRQHLRPAVLVLDRAYALGCILTRRPRRRRGASTRRRRRAARPSSVAWATSKRSKGSRWWRASEATWSAWRGVIGSSSTPARLELGEQVRRSVELAEAALDRGLAGMVTALTTGSTPSDPSAAVAFLLIRLGFAGHPPEHQVRCRAAASRLHAEATRRSRRAARRSRRRSAPAPETRASDAKPPPPARHQPHGRLATAGQHDRPRPSSARSTSCERWVLASCMPTRVAGTAAPFRCYASSAASSGSDRRIRSNRLRRPRGRHPMAILGGRVRAGQAESVRLRRFGLPDRLD